MARPVNPHTVRYRSVHSKVDTVLKNTDRSLMIDVL